jgi:hypothetical protein
MQTTNTQPSNLLLWFSILAGPTAWGTHLSIEYFFTTAQCELAGGDMRPWMAVSTALLFALCLMGLAAGFYARREALHSSTPDSKQTQRRRFMADCGILLSLLFFTGLVMATIPIIFLEPCRVR